MSFSVRKQKQTQSVNIEQEILNSGDIKTEDDLKKFLTDVSKNRTNYKTNRKTSSFATRKSKDSEES